jgi:hypothetical protein
MIGIYAHPDATQTVLITGQRSPGRGLLARDAQVLAIWWCAMSLGGVLGWSGVPG